MIEITDIDTLHRYLGQSSLVLLDFWAPTCAPCLAMLPLLQQIERQHQDVLLLSVNADMHPTLAQGCQVRSLPTLIVYANGSEKKRITGVTGESHILAALAPLRRDHLDEEELIATLSSWRQTPLMARTEQTETIYQQLRRLDARLSQLPQRGDIRALLLHGYLDLWLLQYDPSAVAADIARLQQVPDFSWLRAPDVQQACARAIQVVQQPGTEADYVAEAERCLQRLLQNPNDEDARQQLIPLLDLITDRAVAQQLRRRLHQLLR